MSSFLSMPSVPKLPVLRQAWFAPAPRNGSMGCRVSKHTSLPCCTAHLQWKSYMMLHEAKWKPHSFESLGPHNAWGLMLQAQRLCHVWQMYDIISNQFLCKAFSGFYIYTFWWDFEMVDKLKGSTHINLRLCWAFYAILKIPLRWELCFVPRRLIKVARNSLNNLKGWQVLLTIGFQHGFSACLQRWNRVDVKMPWS